MEKYHVLVIEDDIEIANAIKIYLQNQGYDVYVGNDGIAGLEIVEKETIHLAIVDIMMPRMDGLTMVAKLREKYDFPVIFLSAKSEDIDKIMGLNLPLFPHRKHPPRRIVETARSKELRLVPGHFGIVETLLGEILPECRSQQGLRPREIPCRLG